MAASCRAAPRKLVRPKKGHNREEQSSTSRSRAGSMRFAPDSSLERAGFELRVLSWRGAAFSTPLIPPFARSHTRNAKLPSALGPGVRFALAPAASLVSGDGYERHQFGGTHHVRRSCDFSSRTNSAAHSRASCIFPASRKARAFARAWLSADRSSGDSLPALAPDEARTAGGELRIPTSPTRYQRATSLDRQRFDRKAYLCRQLHGAPRLADHLKDRCIRA